MVSPPHSIRIKWSKHSKKGCVVHYAGAPSIPRAQRKRASGPSPVINKSKKGFGRPKEDSQVEQSQKFSSSGTEAEEDALLFALDFIDIYAVRQKAALWGPIIARLTGCGGLQTMTLRTHLQCLSQTNSVDKRTCFCFRIFLISCGRRWHFWKTSPSSVTAWRWGLSPLIADTSSWEALQKIS